MKPVSQEAAIARSYQLLALLTVCEHSARFIHENPNQAESGAGELAATLELASEIAGELHDRLELGEKEQTEAS